jgi:hypothetical protein
MLIEDFDSDNELTLITTIVWVCKHFKRKEGSSSRHGSIPTRRFIDCDPLQGHQRLFLDYFADVSMCPKVF